MDTLSGFRNHISITKNILGLLQCFWNELDNPALVFGPALLVGESYKTSSVFLSVRQYHNFSRLYFFSEQVSCIFYKSLKVTEPDFRKQSSFAKDSAKWVQNGPNVMFLVTFESFWIISFVWYWKLKYKIIISSQGAGVFSAQKYFCPPPPDLMTYDSLGLWDSLVRFKPLSSVAFSLHLNNIWHNVVTFLRFGIN